jgi:hypothetical protein
MHSQKSKGNTSFILLAAIFLVVLTGIGQRASAQSATASTQVVTVSLSSAQLGALHQSPVQLVPAPGAGQAIVPLGAVFAYKPGSTSYTVSNDSRLCIFEGDVSDSISQISAVMLTRQPGPQLYMALGLNGIGGSQGTFENAPLMVQNDSPVEWNSGNGTVTITIYYVVAPLQ